MAGSDNDVRDNFATASLAIVALAFFPLAIFAPFLRIERLGYASESSLIGGIRELFADGHVLIALVIFLFSIVLPAVKLLTLLALASSPNLIHARHRAVTYRVVEQLGRWGMLDVLLVAVLISFVKLGELVSFHTGPGLYLFAAFVSLNLIAGMTFNPHLLWDETMARDGSRATGESAKENAIQRSQVASDAGPSDATNLTEKSLPIASTKAPGRRIWWLVAIVGVIAAATTGFLLWPESPHRVKITFNDGHGLKAGNVVRYRGIDIGEIEQVRLRSRDGQIEVTACLSQDAAHLASEGTRWWIVRPEVSLSGTAGLETLLGDRYVTLQPGSGEPVQSFVGLSRPPLIDLQFEGGLSIIVQSNSGPRLSHGAGLYHRGVRIGGVREVGLATDASAIEYDVYVRPQYRHLVTRDAVFWNTGGLSVGVGLDGLTFRVDSISEIIGGGMAMAVPERGEPVHDQTRFELNPEPADEWLEWRPSFQETARSPSSAPPLASMAISWKPNGWLTRWTGSRSSRFVAVRAGQDLVVAKTLLPAVDPANVTVRVNDETVPSNFEPVDDPQFPFGDRWAIRSVDVPEEVSVFTETGMSLISAAQWIRDGEGYRMHESLDLTDGSLVLGQDGAVIAWLLDHTLRPVEGSDFVRISSRSDAISANTREAE